MAPSPSEDEGLVGQWRLELAERAGTLLELQGLEPVTLDVDTGRNRLSYHVVNSVDGRVTVGLDTVEFEEETSTLVAPIGVHAELEALFEVVLRSHPRWSRAGERLSISDRAGSRLTFARAL